MKVEEKDGGRAAIFNVPFGFAQDRQFPIFIEKIENRMKESLKTLKTWKRNQV